MEHQIKYYRLPCLTRTKILVIFNKHGFKKWEMEFNSAPVDLMNINCRIIWIRYRCGNCPYFLLHAEDAFVCHRIPLLGIVCYWMKPVYGQWRWITLTPACKGENSTKGKLLYWNNTVQYVCIYKETSQLIYFFFFNLGYYLQICHRGRVEGEKTPRNTVTEHLLNVVLIYAWARISCLSERKNNVFFPYTGSTQW